MTATALSDEPSFAGVLAAADAIAATLPATPAWSYPMLDSRVGARVIVKHENTQPTGAFKVRGGVTLASTLDADERASGVVTVSTGNHAQSIAFAALAGGFEAVIVMPRSAPAVKVDAVIALGATVVIHGDDMPAAGARARELAVERGMRWIDPGAEHAIIHGHATVALELLRSHPEIETLYVPIGSGSGAAGAILVRDAIAPGTRIVGVQSAAAPAAHRSWRSGRIETAPISTFASGLATGAGVATTQRILRAGLDDFILVDDADLRAAMCLMATAAHTLCEGAGAAGLAAILADRDRAGTVAFACTGGNASADELRELAAA